MFLFETSGLKIQVIEDNEKMKSMGVPEFIPAAAVDSTDIASLDGIVYVTSAFFNLSKESQQVILFHEAGHVACGHLKLDEAKTSDLVINDQLEAEADAWAVNQTSVAAFDAALYECGKLIAIAISADETVKQAIAESLEKRIALRNAWMAK